MDKSVFLYWWFSFHLQYYLILSGTNNVLHTLAKKILCPLWNLALAKKSCNNINNIHSQVSRLCYFLWLWFSVYNYPVYKVWFHTFNIWLFCFLLTFTGWAITPFSFGASLLRSSKETLSWSSRASKVSKSLTKYVNDLIWFKIFRQLQSCAKYFEKNWKIKQS